MFPVGTPKTRPEIYAMGFRNPYRIQVDSNDVAYITDYSPDSNTPENFRGPAGTGRVEIVTKPSNYGWPLCYSPNLPYYRWNFNTSRPLDATPTQHECGNPTRGPQNTSRWVRDGGPTVEPGLEYAPPIVQPDIWYAYRDNTPGSLLGTPCLAYYNGSGATTCPRLFPELFTGGVAPHGAAKYEFNAANPNKKKFPPYYDNSMFLGEFGQDTLREVKLDSQGKILKINQLLNCGAVQANRTQPFECDNPNDMQFGADGAFYLLTYGDGFFAANADAGMYKWEYVKGQRAPNAVLNADKTDGPAPLTVNFTSTGTVDADPGDALTYAWDFTNDGTVDATTPNASHTYTANGVYTAKLTVKDSSGNQDVKTTVITVGNTSPTITIQIPTDGDFFEWGQRIPYRVTVTDPEDGAGRLRQGQDHVRAAPQRARARRGREARLLGLAGDAGRGRVARRLHRRWHLRRVHRQGRRQLHPAADHGQAARGAGQAPAARVRPGGVGHHAGQHPGRRDRSGRRAGAQRHRSGRLARAQPLLQPAGDGQEDHVPLRGRRGHAGRRRGPDDRGDPHRFPDGPDRADRDAEVHGHATTTPTRTRRST